MQAEAAARRSGANTASVDPAMDPAEDPASPVDLAGLLPSERLLPFTRSSAAFQRSVPPAQVQVGCAAAHFSVTSTSSTRRC